LAELVRQVKDVVLGSSLNAARFAASTNRYLFLTSEPNFINVFKNHRQAEKERGEYLFTLALYSLLSPAPVMGLGNSDIYISLDEREITQDLMFGSFTLKYTGNLYLFDDNMVQGLPEPLEVVNKGENLVLDWITLSDRFGTTFNFPKGTKKEYLYDTAFINRILIYPSRPDRKPFREKRKESSTRLYVRDRRDALVLSYLTDEELRSGEYTSIEPTRAVDKIVNAIPEIYTGVVKYPIKSSSRRRVYHYPVYVCQEKREIISLEKHIYDDEKGLIYMGDAGKQEKPYLEAKTLWGMGMSTGFQYQPHKYFLREYLNVQKEWVFYEKVF